MTIHQNLAALIRAGLRRDAWEPEYGSAIAWDPDKQRHSQDTVEVNLERAPLVWEPIAPAAEAQPLNALGPLIFLDGVMRMHTRLLLEQGDQYSYSGLGTAIVGGLRLYPGTATSMEKALLPPQVLRCLLLSDTHRLVESTTIPGIPHPFEGVYYAETPEEDAVRMPEQTLQRAMRRAEKEYLEQWLHTDSTFIVDGPLPQYSTVHGQRQRPVVGFIKTLHTRYLPPEQHKVLYQLRPGERSPLFRIGQKQISWYLCLAAPEPTDTPLSGVVRLEMVTDTVQADIPRVQHVADRLCHILPALILARHEDSRSPQNLLPIHTLEKQLKMRMGHRRLLQRYIHDYFRHHFRQQDLQKRL